MRAGPPGWTPTARSSPWKTRIAAGGTLPRSARASRCSRPRYGGDGPVPTRCRRPSPPATSPPPVVELNRAVAVGMAEGPQAGLALVAALEESGRLAGYHLLPATKADMYRRLCRADDAAACYREAIGLAS